MALTTMGRLIPVALALLAVGCLVRETAGLPWEHVHRALLEPHIQSTAAMSALSKRGSTLPACPTHPRAVSQAFINQRVRAKTYTNLACLTPLPLCPFALM
jgi:hypothetical protein